jgi:hypothetical protein
VSQALDDVIHRCLARQPAARFGSAAAVRDALDRARLDPTGAIPRPVVTGGATGAGRVAAPVAAARGAAPPAHTGPTSPQPTPVPAPARPHRRRRLGWLWILLVLIVAVAGGVLAYLLVSDGGSSGGANRTGASSAPSAATATYIANDFDPLGDQTEDHAGVGNVSDHDPNTSWSTDQYVNNFPDGTKTGVGLSFDLGSEHDVRKVIVATQQAGWGASIYVSDKPVSELTSLDDWGAVRKQGSDLPTSYTFDTGGVKGRSVLLWLTQLPTGSNGQHYVEVSEVSIA